MRARCSPCSSACCSRCSAAAAPAAARTPRAGEASSSLPSPVPALRGLQRGAPFPAPPWGAPPFVSSGPALLEVLLPWASPGLRPRPSAQASPSLWVGSHGLAPPLWNRHGPAPSLSPRPRRELSLGRKKAPQRLCGRFSRISMKLPRIPLRRQKLPKVVGKDDVGKESPGNTPRRRRLLGNGCDGVGVGTAGP